MGELRISISDDLHKQLRRIALDEDTSLKELVVSVLKAYAGRESGTDEARKETGD